MNDAAPLVLTLRLERAAFERFDAERRLHFPSDKNFIPAHITLFHHLPGIMGTEIQALVAREAERHRVFPLTVSGLRFLGRGSAYIVESAELVSLRSRLATRWHAHLTPQDAQGFRPHVTIQNKARPADARELHSRLSQAFMPFETEATGLLLWRYLGGPWEPLGEFPFETPSPSRGP